MVAIVVQPLVQQIAHAKVADHGMCRAALQVGVAEAAHEIKIDRSFVADMAAQERDRAIVRSTIDLGHNLGLAAVAEGVEDQCTLDLLGGLGCDLAQGYFLSRPLPAGQISAWCRGRLDRPQLLAA